MRGKVEVQVQVEDQVELASGPLAIAPQAARTSQLRKAHLFQVSNFSVSTTLERFLHHELPLLRRFDRTLDVSSHPFDGLLTRQIEQLLRQTGGEESGSPYPGRAVDDDVAA